MAYSKVVTTVANPARKGKTVAKRKHYSAAQIRAGFGGKRRQNALKTKRRHSTAKKRSNPPKRSSAVKRHNAKKHSSAPRRRNTGEILVLTAGNPAKKGKAMAKKKHYSKKKHSAGARHRSNAAGSRHHVKKHYSRHSRRNPGALGRPMDWIKGGIGVIGGGVGTRLIPQMILPSQNTSYTGYALNAGTALLLAWGTHAVTKDKVLTAAVAAGGFAALILRIVNDQSSVGKYLALSGMGDYMMSNWQVPQRITDPRQAMFEMGGAGALAAVSAAANGQDGSGNC